MKKLLFIIFLALTPWFHANANNKTTSNTTKPKLWSYKGRYNLVMNQISFSDWATGGENAISGMARIDYYLKYKKNKFTFEQDAHLAYGIAGYSDKGIEKTDDKLDVSLSAGRNISKKWDFAGMFIFKSQFTKGYKYPDDSDVVSTFMAPAYLTISAGFNYKPSKHFQLFLSPLSGKLTFVLNQDLANHGAFGVQKAVYDSLGTLLVPGRKYLGVLGVNILCTYEAELMKNIDFRTHLNLYNNYLEPRVDMRWQLDMDWNNRVTFKINKYFATVFYLHLRYNPKVLFPEYQMVNDVNTVVSERTKLQVKESLGVGFTYKIN